MATIQELQRAIRALEIKRGVLGDDVVDLAITALKASLQDKQSEAPYEQRKLVTILFADISDFTGLAENLDAEVVRTMMNHVWERLDATIINFGGTIDKHIGDAVMAVFGAPNAREDDPQRAIRAALAMQKELAKIDHEREKSGETLARIDRTVRMRIAVHTGPVLLGPVGLTREYTAIGDAVNLASRLQDAAPVGRILISQETYQHVRGVFEVEPQGALEVRGRKEPVWGYLIEGLKPRAYRVPQRGVEGIETEMIGRSKELQLLKDQFVTVAETSRSRALTVIGETGVGKTRLLYEFDKWLEERQNTFWQLKGRISQATNQYPYALIRDLIAHQFEINDSDPSAVAKQKLETGIVRFMGIDGVMRAHIIGQLIGLDFSNSVYLEDIKDDAIQIRSRAFYYLAQFFRAVTNPLIQSDGRIGGGQLVIFLEDIHWADDGSLGFIQYLLENAKNIPILLVCLARPSLIERKPKWAENWGNHQYIHLNALTERESIELVSNILRKVRNLPYEIKSIVVKTSEGNPYFTEELIKKLIDDGVIIKNEPYWEIKSSGIENILVPPTLMGVLQARLDGLSQAEKDVLQIASVVGRVFWRNTVEKLLAAESKKVPDFLKVLESLTEREMIIQRKDSAFARTQEYIFKHAIFHDVTYESVLLRNRRRYHDQVAKWLIEGSGERASQYAGLIGKHLELAGNAQNAVEWYLLAGNQALEAYVPAGAIEYFLKGQSLLEESKNNQLQMLLFEGLGNAFYIQAQFTDAEDAYQKMRKYASEEHELAAQARAWNGLARVQDVQGNFRYSLDSAAQAEKLARMSGDQYELVHALYRKGWSYFRLGEGEFALIIGEQVLELARELNAKREIGYCLSLIGISNLILGRFSKAVKFQKDALEVFQELGDRDQIGAMYNNLGVNALARGEYNVAVEILQEALDIAREVGNKNSEMMREVNYSGALIGQGDFAQAEENLRRVIDQAIETTGWGGFSKAYRFLAEACLGQGNLSEGLSYAREALSLGQLMGSQEDTGIGWRVLGESIATNNATIAVANREDRQMLRYDAPECYAKSLSIFTEAGMDGEKARTLRAWASYLDGIGEMALADEKWRDALDLFDTLGMDVEKERTKTLFAAKPV